MKINMEKEKKPERKKKPEREKKPAVPKEPKEQKPQHRVITSLVGNLSHALEHEVDADEVSEVHEEKPQAEKYHDREKRPVKYRFFLVFGLVVFWLAIMGMLSVVSTFRELAFDITNQTALKEEFELFLFPVVINDPPEFSGAENMPASVIISSAVWQIILTGDKSNYDRGMATISIPENDVEMAARSIFGSGFDIMHMSSGNIVTPFLYEAETKSYTVPENPPFFTFSPRVSEITSTGDSYRVIVEYIAPNPQFIAGIEYEIEPVKTMIFTITRTKDRNKTIQSIELNKDNEEFIHF
ncbi:MAG: hypothetical protein FWE74_00610 [Oscillospiraceae bacterium]|nr:hypothetical protein [Oscillospiraceae bacterium]